MSKQWDWLIAPELYRIEWVYLAALILLSCLLPRRSSILGSINRVLRQLANRRRAAVLATVLLVLVGRLALMGSLGIPRPGTADEFGYLLTADTFAHLRMSNPTAPLWKPLETIHVFHTPTYQSQFPIGYPLVLAFAQLAFKNPWWGVYLTTALMCGAITWMLQAWLPPYWALIGGLFVAIRFGLFTYWMNSFWGGSLAALGGALVFGALPRVIKRFSRARPAPTLDCSVLLALGVASLATTRPFEGLVICVPAAAVFLHWLLSQHGPSLRYWLWRTAVPCIVVLGLTAAITLYYQYRVTGHALESPYDVALRQIHVSRPFVFQKPMPTPHYDNLEMRFVYVHYAAQLADKMHDPYGFLDTLRIRLTWYWQFFVGPLMTLPLLASLLTLGDRKLRLVWATVILLAIAVLLENWIQVHYLAPGMCLFMLFLLQGARRIKVLYVGSYAAGARITRALPVLCVLMLGLRASGLTGADDMVVNHWPPNWAYSTQRLYYREWIEDTLSAVPGQHVVLVRYHYPFHSYHQELVFNGADLAGSKILWARSMDVKQNCAFVNTYRERKLWVIDEWGDIKKFLPATNEEICNPSNPIYEPNWPLDYYTNLYALRAGLPQKLADNHAASHSVR